MILPSSSSGATFSEFADQFRTEVEALLDILPEALSRQWEPSPVPKPREDTSERSSGGSPSRPVEALVFDGRRLAVREALGKVFVAVKQLQVAGDNLSRSVARFDGDDAHVAD